MYVPVIWLPLFTPVNVMVPMSLATAKVNLLPFTMTNAIISAQEENASCRVLTVKLVGNGSARVLISCSTRRGIRPDQSFHA